MEKIVLVKQQTSCWIYLLLAVRGVSRSMKLINYDTTQGKKVGDWKSVFFLETMKKQSRTGVRYAVEEE